MSFLGESRRLDNARLKRELARALLRYPTVADGLLDPVPSGGASTRDNRPR